MNNIIKYFQLFETIQTQLTTLKEYLEETKSNFFEGEIEKLEQKLSELIKIEKSLQELQDQLPIVIENKNASILRSSVSLTEQQFAELKSSIIAELKLLMIAELNLHSSESFNQLSEVNVEPYYIKNEIDLNDEEQKLVENYKSDDYDYKNLSSWNPISVKIDRNSEGKNRFGTNDMTILKKDESNDAAYFVIKIEGEYYLVPKPAKSYDQYRISSIKGLFECRNYISGAKANKLKLLQPGKLSIISEEEWQLEKDGILDFSE